MRLKETYGWRTPDRTYSIEDAVTAELDGTDYDRGRLEEVEATSANTARFVGKLTERLFDKGVLSKEDIAALLTGYVPAE